MSPTILTNCRLATMKEGAAPYGLIDDGAVVIEDGQIAWSGSRSELPDIYSNEAKEDLGGRLVTPCLIDCHTHLIYGGDRAAEFEMRLNGASYEEIAKAGGGINATVTATRAASDEALLTSALTRLDNLLAEGVGVVEIKSGYGLTIGDEIRMLRLARRLEKMRPIKIKTTWLAAHATPNDFKGSANEYIDNVAIQGLEQAVSEGLVDAVDGFCENIAFSPAQIERLFDKARALGLPVKLHAEQLSDQKGAVMAAKYSALSADHLEYLSATDVGALAEAGTVAVLLPGAFYTLRETKLPPISALRDAKVKMAVATDCNPGSSPLSSLLTAMNMACTLFQLTPEEALLGVTRNAAAALGIDDAYGVIEQGKYADLAIWNIEHPAALAYHIGARPLHKRIHEKEA